MNNDKSIDILRVVKERRMNREQWLQDNVSKTTQEQKTQPKFSLDDIRQKLNS